MQNVDYWNTFVGEESPETFMRNYGSSDPELCVARFLEERGQLYGVVNQGSWRNTFAMPEQHHCLTVKVYLLSYLEDTREDWLPPLQASPPATPRRYREKFDTDRFPPPGSAQESSVEEAGTYGTYIPESDHHADATPAELPLEDADVSFEEFDSESRESARGIDAPADESYAPMSADVVVPEAETPADEHSAEDH
jgi:hypothetical protein